MVYALTWLPEVLEAAGLKVAETPGWRTRGRAEMGQVRGVMCHHTATMVGGNMPTLNLLVSGRSSTDAAPGLAGPLAQLGLGRDGAYYVIAAGRANHAGGGRWEGVTAGNSSFIGIEAENSGRPDDFWPVVQMDAYVRGVAAILRHIGAPAGMCCGHKEYARPAGRKIDPTFDMPLFRGQVADILAGKTAPALIPLHDEQQRPTLRRGATGALVRQVQTALAIRVDGVFGPATEAKLRVLQRSAGLVPDGIVGPKTWAALHQAAAAQAPYPSAAAAAVAETPAAAPEAPSVLPPADDAGHPVRLDGKLALGPDGKRFASMYREGLYTAGVIPLGAWLDSLPQPPSATSAARAVRAVCVNEGGLEAINSWDDCHLSFGVFQWTAGADADPGELPSLMSDFKRTDGAAFQDCFGRYGLDVAALPGGAHRSAFSLNGALLATGTDKEVLRRPEWAYRFWRAGHHPTMRRAQFAKAMGRIDLFISSPVAQRPLCAWLTSELGVALVLDEHVNRPGHVPGTLESAVAQLGGGQADPTGWTTSDEARLIGAYLAARRATNMTDSDGRARKIEALAQAGQLWASRGSYVQSPRG